MGVIKNCLTMIGLMVVLLVGSCVAGVRGCARVSDPKVWHEQVDEEPVKTRRMLADYLQTATFETESMLSVRGAPGRVAVQNYTDGSIHLTLDGKGRRLVEVVVQVTGDGEGSRVDVISDATVLAEVEGTPAAYLHQHIRSELERGLDAIDHHQPLGGGFSMARLIRAADRDA